MTGVYVLYLDFVTDMLKLAVYTAFFFIIFHFYGLPLRICTITLAISTASVAFYFIA